MLQSYYIIYFQFETMHANYLQFNHTLHGPFTRA